MSKTHKIILTTSDLPKLKKHGCLRVGKNLIIIDKHPIHQIKVFGKYDKFKDDGGIF